VSEKKSTTEQQAETSVAQAKSQPRPNPPQSTQQRFEDIYDSYLKALQQIGTDTQQKLEKASLDYRRALLEHHLQLGTPEAVGQALQGLQRAGTDSWTAVQGPARAKDAYRDFLRAFQKALAESDLNSIDPVLLAGIGRSLQAVAYYASSHFEPQGQSRK
jgi:hypothetical protein